MDPYTTLLNPTTHKTAVLPEIFLATRIWNIPYIIGSDRILIHTSALSFRLSLNKSRNGTDSSAKVSDKGILLHQLACLSFLGERLLYAMWNILYFVSWNVLIKTKNKTPFSFNKKLLNFFWTYLNFLDLKCYLLVFYFITSFLPSSHLFDEFISFFSTSFSF